MTMTNYNISDYVLKYKNEKGFTNIIPLWPESKKPAVADYDYWFNNVYDGAFLPEQNIGVILGEIGGNVFGVDDDTFGHGEILEKFPKTFKTKSGEKGFHRFYRMAELPPYNGIKATKDGHVIEFFFRKRQFVLPPSIHPDSKQRYEILDDLPVTTISKSEFESMLKTLDEDGWILRKNDQEKNVIDRMNEGLKLGKGENRSQDLLSFIDSVVRKLHKYNLPESVYQQLGLWYHREFTTEMYPQSKIEGIIKQAFDWANAQPEKNIQEDFNNIMNNGCGDLSPMIAATKLIGLYIKKDRVIEKAELRKLLNNWIHKYNLGKEIGVRDVDLCLGLVWGNKAVLEEVRNIAFNHGKNHHVLSLDADQLAEAAYWLLGRYSIKRIELTGELLFFNDRCYSRDTEEFVKREARKLLVEADKKATNEIVALVEDVSPIIKSKDLNHFSHLRVLENGTYNIKTGEFSPDFDPQYIILNEVPHKYDESATWDRINKTIEEILPKEEDRQSFYDFLSTCLHPHTGIDLMFVGVGISGTGKSQLGEKFPPMLFGEDNVSFSTIHSISKDPTVQNDIAFKMLNVDPELSDRDINHIDVIKKWVTQDKFTSRSIYSHSSTFRPTSRLMGMANSLFEIENDYDADAIYERTHLVRMDQKFRKTTKEVKNVFEKIVNEHPTELDGMITYLLKNATEIYEKQKIHYPMSANQVEAVWNEFGNYIRDFIKKHIIRTTDETRSVKREAVWIAWQDYALEREVDEKTKNKFYEKFQRIIEIEPTKMKDERGMVIVAFPGIRLKTDDEITADEKKASAEVLRKSLD